MLIDTFLYAGERHLLDLRMAELGSKVDMFVAVEGWLTFTGKERHIEPLDLPGLIHWVVGDYPDANTPWKREGWQRNAILKALKGLDGDIVVMVSDVDELPRLDAIPKTVESGQLFILEQETYHFNLKHKVISSNEKFPMGMCTRICRYDDLQKWYPQGVRNLPGVLIPNGGWHLSWMTDPQEKAESYSHQELKNFGGTYAEQVKERWELGYAEMPDLTHLPQTIQAHPEQWTKYL